MNLFLKWKLLFNRKKLKKVVPINICEKCLNFMRIEKRDKDYALVCDYCENNHEEDERCWCLNSVWILFLNIIMFKMYKY